MKKMILMFALMISMFALVGCDGTTVTVLDATTDGDQTSVDGDVPGGGSTTDGDVDPTTDGDDSNVDGDDDGWSGHPNYGDDDQVDGDDEAKEDVIVEHECEDGDDSGCSDGFVCRYNQCVPDIDCRIELDCRIHDTFFCKDLTCEDGHCVPVDTSDMCDDDNVCTRDSCDDELDTCVNESLHQVVCGDGMSCESGECVEVPDNTCETNDDCEEDDLFCLDIVCLSGLCQAVPTIACNDGNECTFDMCNEIEEVHCSNDPMTGVICGTGNVCDAGECVEPVDGDTDEPVDGDDDEEETSTTCSIDNPCTDNDDDPCTFARCDDGICVQQEETACWECSAHEICAEVETGVCVTLGGVERSYYPKVEEGIGFCSFPGKCQLDVEICDDGCNADTGLCNQTIEDECQTEVDCEGSENGPYCVYSSVLEVSFCQPCTQDPELGCADGEHCYWGIQAGTNYEWVSVYWCEEGCIDVSECDDSDPCTQDECHALEGCANIPLDDCVHCEDATICEDQDPVCLADDTSLYYSGTCTWVEGDDIGSCDRAYDICEVTNICMRPTGLCLEPSCAVDADCGTGDYCSENGLCYISEDLYCYFICPEGKDTVVIWHSNNQTTEIQCADVELDCGGLIPDCNNEECSDHERLCSDQTFFLPENELCSWGEDYPTFHFNLRNGADWGEGDLAEVHCNYGVVKYPEENEGALGKMEVTIPAKDCD